MRPRSSRFPLALSLSRSPSLSLWPACSGFDLLPRFCFLLFCGSFFCCSRCGICHLKAAPARPRSFIMYRGILFLFFLALVSCVFFSFFFCFGSLCIFLFLFLVLFFFCSVSLGIFFFCLPLALFIQTNLICALLSCCARSYAWTPVWQVACLLAVCVCVVILAFHALGACCSHAFCCPLSGIFWAFSLPSPCLLEPHAKSC